jgi:uncharacterized protein YecE (DUF72 family)
MASPPIETEPRRPGRLFTGTSGYSYGGWAPRFYPARLRAPDLLDFYASRLNAVELNNTYYASPSATKVERWLAATPAGFRFAVKAQRGGSFRSLQVDPTESVPWLTQPYRAFGDRLGTVLFRVPEGVKRDDEKLAALLAAWPADLPLTMEFQDPSWHVDETFGALATAGAALCTTESPDDDGPPTMRRTGSFLYLRLRRLDYSQAELTAWAARIEPFLAAGDDAYVFFRHDPDGRGPELALELEQTLSPSRETPRPDRT